MQTGLATHPRERDVLGPLILEMLVPSDLTDASDEAAAAAAMLAARFGSRLTLYHALEFRDHEEPHWAFGDRVGVLNEEERLARAHLADCGRTMDLVHQEVIERAASPVRALLQRIESTAPDLVVMATKSRGALEHALEGSVTEQVVRGSRVPVLCLRGAEPLERQLAGRIVLLSDFSPTDRPALLMAGLLAGSFGGELVVVHTPPRKAFAGWRDPAADQPWRPYAAAQHWLEPLPRNLTARVVMSTAAPPRSALRVAEHERAGLIVIPRATAGSHCDVGGRIVRHARCSVLVV